MIWRNTKVNDSSPDNISCVRNYTYEQSDTVQQKQHRKCCITSELMTLWQSIEKCILLPVFLLLK